MSLSSPSPAVIGRVVVAVVVTCGLLATTVPAVASDASVDAGLRTRVAASLRCVAAARAAGDPVAGCHDPEVGTRRAVVTMPAQGVAAATGVGTITGTVIADDTGLGLDDACVDAFSDQNFEGAFTQTASDGSYQLQDLPPGDYLVSFADCREQTEYVGEFFDDASEFEDADLVTVVPGGTVVADAGLALGGAITGTITTTDDGPLQDGCVVASGATGLGFGFGNADADGQYRVGGLATDDYVVTFYDCADRARYAPEYFDDTRSLDDATLVAVTAGDATDGVDAELAVGAVLSGRVTNEQTGEGIELSCVDVFGTGDLAFGFSFGTSADGDYRIGGLVDDDYQVQFSDCGENDYVREFHDDAVRRADLALVTLEVGATRADLDAALEPVSFTDVRLRHPFREEIHFMAANAIASGYDDGSYRPDGDVTRQAMSAFLWRLFGEPEVATDCTVFSDVPADHPFCTEIGFMAESGISTGYDDGTFRPGERVSRAAMSAFLHRFSGEPDVSVDCTVFSDVPADHPFCTEIGFMAEFGISDGYDDGTYRPAARVTRQAMAAFLGRVGGGFAFEDEAATG